MKEEKFYDICDKTESIDMDITEGFFPSVEEIEKNVNAYGVENQVEIISYFASNPFKRLNMKQKDDEKYLNTVLYCKKILSEIQLEG